MCIQILREKFLTSRLKVAVFHIYLFELEMTSTFKMMKNCIDTYLKVNEMLFVKKNEMWL